MSLIIQPTCLICENDLIVLEKNNFIRKDYSSIEYLLECKKCGQKHKVNVENIKYYANTLIK